MSDAAGDLPSAHLLELIILNTGTSGRWKPHQTGRRRRGAHRQTGDGGCLSGDPRAYFGWNPITGQRYRFH